MNGKRDIIARNRLRCVNAIILCAVVIVGTFIGVVTKLVAESTVSDPDEGIRSFRYFTVLSNMLMAFSATLCIPFEVDGLRNHNYHLPRWVVGALYCGVCGVTITFTIAAGLLVPIQGVEPALLQKASLYLHLICPVAAMLLFIFVNDDHRIPFRHSFFVLIPLLVYALIYWLQVFVIGAWRDHYYTNAYFPYWIAMIAIPILGFALANGIRVLHNRQHARHKAETEKYYLTDPAFACDCIEDALVALARREKPLDRGGEVIVPRRLIRMLAKRYQSGAPIEDLCKYYLEAYLKEEI